MGLHGTAASRNGAAAELLRALAGVLTALLAIAALVVVWRRLAGALDSPLGPSMLGLAGLLLIGMAWVARAACVSSRRDLPSRILISMAVVVLAAGVTLPGVNGVAPDRVLGHSHWRGVLGLATRSASALAKHSRAGRFAAADVRNRARRAG